LRVAKIRTFLTPANFSNPKIKPKRKHLKNKEIVFAKRKEKREKVA